MKLGAFSVSLAVKDIKASKAFYETLGFTVFAGDLKRNYLIMKNGSTIIGLFQGMFENNILTFNPGWDENASKLDSFDDIMLLVFVGNNNNENDDDDDSDDDENDDNDNAEKSTAARTTTTTTR